MSKNKLQQQQPTAISMSVFPRFFCFISFSDASQRSAMGVQKQYKKRFAKNSCRKSFTKESTKHPKPI
jgi:hypothetical protein